MVVDPIEEIIEEETGTSETPDTTFEGSNNSVDTNVIFGSVYDLIQTAINVPLFYFTETFLDRSLEAGRNPSSPFSTPEKYISIKQIMDSKEFINLLPKQFADRYENIISWTDADTLEGDITSLMQDMFDYFETSKSFQYEKPIEAEGFKQGATETVGLKFNARKTRKGSVYANSVVTGNPSPTLDVSFDTVIDIFTGSVKGTVEYNTEVKEAQTEQEMLEERQKEAVTTVVDNDGTVRTSSPAWGYKTDNDGKIVNSEGKKVIAPFFKNDEWNDFSDLSEADIFRLQKQMVQAGMQPPPVNEYGQWTKREANFMAMVFQKSTDSGQWEIDQTNGLSGYETTLIDLGETYQETVDFINVLNTSNYGMPSPSPTTAEIKTLLDTAAAANGVVLSAKDYTDFANVVIKALSEEANSQRAFENAQVTDRDLILGTSFKNARTIGEGEVARFLSGTDLPLVLPSYEFLTKSKGPVPEIKSSATILEDEIARLKAPQIAGNVDLRNIAYTTNLFETAMGQLTYGGAESTG